jgi:hypothetical protein
MSEKVTINGEEYKLSNNPSLRTVRHVQNMQMDMIMNYVEEDDLREMDSLEDESEIIQAILDSGGMEALQDVMWERSMLENAQTISLACDNVIETSDLEEVGAQDYKKIKDKAKEALGGDASDFFNELEVGTMLSEEEMNRTANQT